MTMALLKIGENVAQLVVQPMPALRSLPSWWYLLRVHPGREFKVMRGFNRSGIASYLPTFPKQQRSERMCRVVMSTVVRPLFPGLIFIPEFEADIDRLRTVDGVTSFLHFGDAVARLSPQLFEEVRQLEAVLAVPRSKRYRAGDELLIKDGPFAGWISRFDRLEDGGRIRVLIDTIQRGLSVTIAESQVEPV